MLTAAPEDWTEFLPELRGLIDGHYQQLALNKDRVPLRPMWAEYEAKDRAGQLMLIVLRASGQAAGYHISFLTRHMHYETCLTCFTDIFWVVPEYRNAWGGVRLFKAVEAEARRRGAQRIICATKLHSDAAPLLRFCRFVEIERNFSKWIGP